MDPGAPPPPPPGDDDPFRELLDPGFVERATLREPTAEQRAVAARERRARVEAAPGVQAAPPRRRRRRSGRAARWTGAVVVVALVVAVSLALAGDWRPSTPESSVAPSAGGSSSVAAPVKRRPENWPTEPPLSSSQPLGTPPPVTAGGAHAFAALQADGVTPVAWDPCRPVRYVVRPGGPAGADLLLRQAIDRVSAATGLQFVDQGPTDEAPGDDRPPFQPERYGDEWAPVLVAWSDPTESPLLAQQEEAAGGTTDVAGRGGATAVGWEGEPSVYVSGSLVLDEPDLTRLLARRDGWDTVRAVIMHELAHVVGLDHVEDPTQLMNPRTTPGVVEFGDGDLEGLAALGRGPCVPDV